jgi:AcrR family transcriptional regulator
MARGAKVSEPTGSGRGSIAPKAADGSKLTLRDHQKMLTRAKLLESASIVFEEKGYGRATVGDIVAGAGASHGTFYLYFPAKASVIVELMETGWVAELNDQLKGLSELGEPTEANVAAWLKDFLGLYGRNAGTLRAWAQASIEEHPLMSQTDNYVRTMVDGVAAAIRKYQKARRSTRAEMPAELLAMTLVFELERVCFFKYVRRWKIQDSIVDVLAQRWHAAIAGA